MTFTQRTRLINIANRLRDLEADIRNLVTPVVCERWISGADYEELAIATDSELKIMLDKLR